MGTINSPLIRRALAVVAAGALSAFLSVGPAHARQTGTHARFEQMQAIGQDIPSVVARAVDIGPIDPNQHLYITVNLPYAHPDDAQAFADSVSDPKSPEFHHFITPEEVGQRFGLATSQVNQVVTYLQSKGLKVTFVSKNRLTIIAEGTAQQVQEAFGATIKNMAATPRNKWEPATFFANDTPIKLPVGIAPYVMDVEGLENFVRPMPRTTTLTPALTAGLYGVQHIFDNSHHGENRTVAESSFDGFRLSNIPIFCSTFSIPTPPGGAGSNISVETIAGGSGSGSAGGEGDLDIQMELGMAPLGNIIVYDGAGSGAGLTGALALEASDNTADVISESYGWKLDSGTATTCHNSHLSMTMQGITYMAASGDSGTDTQGFDYPNYEPEVLMVGGTIADVNSGTGARNTEDGWNGSGSGWSTKAATFNHLPSWQVGTGVPTGNDHRLWPDVALHAAGDNNFMFAGYEFILNGGLSGADGTSFASPVFAGSLGTAEGQIIAGGGLFADGAGKHRFGRIQDYIYGQNGRSEIWYDVTTGDAGQLPDLTESVGKANWDFVTGWGAIDFNQFATRAFTTISNLNPSSATAGGGAFTLTVNGSDFTPGCTVQWNASNRTTTYVSKNQLTASITAADIQNGGSAAVRVLSPGISYSNIKTFTINGGGGISLTNLGISPSTVVGGQTTTGTVTMSGNAGSNTTVNLSSNSTAVSVPSSVTVLTGHSTATFTVTTAAVSATVTRTVTATYNAVNKTANVTMTPGLKTLTVNPATVVGGANTTGTVTLYGPAPAGGAVVSLSANSGVLVPPSTVTVVAGATSANFTIATARVGATYVRIVTATYAGVSRSALVTLNPGLKSFTISPMSVVGGNNATGTITLLGPAPAGGQVVTVTSGSSIIHVPPTVTVPAGATSVNFTIGTSSVSGSFARPVTVTLANVTITVYLTVHS